MPSSETDSSASPLYLGIDVGTGSARAAIFTVEGAQVGEAIACPIRLYKPEGFPLLYQQSSEDIWRAVCRAVRGALACGALATSTEKNAGRNTVVADGGRIESEGLCATEDIRKRVVALAIDATCSLVVLGADDRPVSVTPEDTTAMEEEGGEEDIPNVILWLDHRATAEAAEINAKGKAGREGIGGEDGKAVANRLRFVGDNLSPENEVPKLLWLKRHLKKRVWGVEEEEEEEEMETEEKGKQPVREGEKRQCQARFWDLGDYLSYRATKGEAGRGGGVAGGRHGAEEVRSLCCVASKWMYAQGEDGGRWDQKFLSSIGLGDLGPAQLGSLIRRPGEVWGKLDRNAAVDLGLAGDRSEGQSSSSSSSSSSTPILVGVGAVDAFAGAIGSLGGPLGETPAVCRLEGGGEGGGGGKAERGGGGDGGRKGGGGGDEGRQREGGRCHVPMEARLALISGTSTCHLSCSPSPVFCPNVWGPFYDVLGTGAWVSEGGISASGKLIDLLLESHPAYLEAQRKARLHEEFGPWQHGHGTGYVQQYLNKHLASMAGARGLPSLALLTVHLHVGPDFAGNRSPIGDPALTGSLIGLGLDAASLDALALLYLATLQALALGTQHILEALHAAGHPGGISHLCVSGGLGLKNDLFCQVHADVTHCTLVLPPAGTEGVLLGSAMLAATAAGRYATVQEAMRGMSRGTGERRLVCPCEDPRVQAFYAGKRDVFHAMREDQVRYRARMKEAMGEGGGTEV